MARTKEDTIKNITTEYLRDIDIDNYPDPEQIKGDLLERIHDSFELENSCKDKNNKWKIPQELDGSVIAQIILRLYHVRRLMWSGAKVGINYDLVVYQTEGENEGLYISDKTELRKIIRLYNNKMQTKATEDVIDRLCENAPICKLEDDPDLIAVNNGIFNYRTKELLPFDPKYIFNTKSQVNYVENAQKVIIHNECDNTDWDVDSWMNELSDDAEVIELLWQVLGAIVRPHVPWDKMVCLYNEKGNNGKGTLCQLMRNLCGAENCASISLEAFSQEFMLEELTHSLAVITDENQTKVFIKNTSLLKAVITGDFLKINRKFEKAISSRFRGLIVQCINDFPKFGDKTDSFYRRMLIIPFVKCFTGQERKYIKQDYLNRPEVLEYVLCKVLNSDYDEFINPKVCESMLDIYKGFNDPIRTFLDEVLPQCQWDLVPFSFLYDLYKAWMDKNCPQGQKQSKQTFIKDVRNMVDDYAEWRAPENSIEPRNKMNKPEPMIYEYGLANWQNPHYRGYDIAQICTPYLKSSYKGLQRI